jgi:hypothetical protein
MLRLVERVLGEGDLHRDGRILCRAGYELSVYQHWDTTGGALVPRHFEVEGHLIAAPERVEAALGTASPCTLHLDDGRRFDLYVLNPEGAVTRADDRGLYRAGD